MDEAELSPTARIMQSVCSLLFVGEHVLPFSQVRDRMQAPEFTFPNPAKQRNQQCVIRNASALRDFLHPIVLRAGGRELRTAALDRILYLLSKVCE